MVKVLTSAKTPLNIRPSYGMSNSEYNKDASILLAAEADIGLNKKIKILIHYFHKNFWTRREGD